MFGDLKLFAMAQKSMDWLARRQEVLAQNVANVDTPKYQAKDLQPLDFKNALRDTAPTVRAVVTNPVHISPEVDASSFKTVTERRPEESKPNGNTVLLDEQMNKIGEVKGNYELTINLMQKHLNMLRTALDKGGV